MQKLKQLESLLVIVVALAIIARVKRSDVFLDIAIITGVLGLLVPPLTGWIHLAWNGLSRLLGAVSEKILLTLIYVLVLIPMSALARLLGKFRPGKNLQNGSYLRERNHRYTKDDLENLW